ncbi:MAG: RnfABCDGE type electron transport complex subunit D [Deferribacterales bacterium]
MPDRLLVTFSPHDRDTVTTDKIMMDVVIALIPVMLASVYFYGYYAVKGYLLTTLFCMGFEYAFNKILKQPCSLRDNSALLTGVLLSMNMPAGAPWWAMLCGSFVAIVMSKQVYGGLGQNPFNPALVARIFLLIAWPAEMTSWVKPGGSFFFDAVSSATPLGLTKADIIAHGQIMAHNVSTYSDQIFGNVSGCLGGDGAIFVLVGGAYMLSRRIITWHIPVTFIGTVFIFSGIVWLIAPHRALDPFMHIISGGVMLGAFFMATDYVTSPINKKAQLIFGIGCGVITCLIRIYGSYPDGVGFAILIMNAFVPLMDKYMRPASFGEVRA